MNNIKDKVVIITGASSGMGAEIAKQLGEKRAKLVIAARDEKKLIDVKNEVEKLGGEAVYAITDVSKHEDVENMVKLALDTYGHIDVLINNAAIMPASYYSKNDYKEWDQLIDINIKGVLYSIGEVLPHMRERKKGHIINVSSTAAHHNAEAYASVYAATKHAVRVISEGVRKEESMFKTNIRVTDMTPGMIDSGLKYTVTDPEMREFVLKMYSDENVPKLSPADMARAISYVINEPENIMINEIIVTPTNS